MNPRARRTRANAGSVGAAGGLVLQGMVPIRPARLATELIAGLTLAALAIPEVLGYARIAGMPVVAGLYTIALPMLVFAIFGASRHLVVGADSATAAITLAAVGSLAVPGSPRYVQLVGLTALLTGALLILARVARLGFLANFLSRTVLIGFLSGVGVSVAIGQLPELLGLPVHGSTALLTLVRTLRALPDSSLATAGVAAAGIGTVLASGRLSPRVPGALVVVIGSIALSYWWQPASHGIRLVGAVPSGLPSFRAPALDARAASAVLLTSVSMAVVVLAQSAATARAYAARYDEEFDENADLFALGLANLAASVTGAFVVNGSPTKTEMLDGAGGRSQLSQLTCSALVFATLLVATAPLSRLPQPVLAAVVFLIGIALIDRAGLTRLARVRRSEFVVASLTAGAVLAIGIEQAIGLAIVASVIDHLRRGYDPRTQVLTRNPGGHWQVVAPDPEQRTRPGLVIYRFPSSMYYANAHKLAADLAGFVNSAAPLSQFCLDCSGVSDLDYTAAEVLRHAIARLAARGTSFAFATGEAGLLHQLDLYGLLTGPVRSYPTPGAALDDFDRQPPIAGTEAEAD
ncbi:MAG: SulP family inorganic anion transporter [Jatrophihabitantaceae bacterium]